MQYSNYARYIAQGLDESFEHIVRAQNARVDMEKEPTGSSKYYLAAAKMHNMLRHHNISLANFHDKQGIPGKAEEHMALADDLHKKATDALAQFHFAKAKELANDDIEQSVNHQMKGEEELVNLKKLG